ncbi:MAG TPA: hypothetical protein VN326_06730 [Casimicrobiaceae bacterium]|jgi:hypothetical protein|nr:hypothetical protein [Casimicrobiaceae bacterium]
MREGGLCPDRGGIVLTIVLAFATSVVPAQPLHPILIAQTAAPGAPPSPPVPQPVLPVPAAPVAVEAPPPSPAPVNEEEQQTIALLLELQRYTGESNEELRRELAAAMQALNRARTEPNRIRAAVLLTLPGAGPPDDARAMALLESVSGKTPGASPIKQLAAVLLAQIAERVRGMSEERKKSAAAQEKLDQLRAVERSLLLERNRNAGGAGGGGGGGGTGR